MKEKHCAGCNVAIYRIKPPFQRRSIPVNTELLWIKKDPNGLNYIKTDGTTVIGYAVGDSNDDNDLIAAYEPHLAVCPYNGRAPRKPRNRTKEGAVKR